jgi:hypothetical protein
VGYVANDCGTEMSRPLVRRVNRRVIRRKGMRGGRHYPQSADTAFHPHLSMAHGELE